MKKTIFTILSLVVAAVICLGLGSSALASETTGDMSTEVQSGMEGIIKAAPTASPAAGTYTSTQTVSLTASGATKICYTTNSTTPACATSITCTTGTALTSGSSISISSTTTVKAVACYADASESPTPYSGTYTISSGGGGGGGSYTPSYPTVSLIYPVNYSTGLALTVQPYISFSDAMKAASISPSTVKLCLVSDTTCANPVAATVALSENNYKATITPTSSLLNSTAYWLYVTTGVQSADGYAMTSAYGSTTITKFTTVAVGETPTTTTPPTTTPPVTTPPVTTPPATTKYVPVTRTTNIDTAAEAAALAKYESIAGAAPTTAAQQQVVSYLAYNAPTPSQRTTTYERGRLMEDYMSIFGKLPGRDNEWQDIDNILNGERTVNRNLKAEAEAMKSFIKVYKRLPGNKLNAAENTKDWWAVHYIAYGIRVIERDLNVERAAITVFKSVYGRVPSSGLDWNIMRAVAYSGAKR